MMISKCVWIPLVEEQIKRPWQNDYLLLANLAFPFTAESIYPVAAAGGDGAEASC